ncbi:hypothetical protein GCM10025762_18860 [Haloechinothrix salitolerans]
MSWSVVIVYASLRFPVVVGQVADVYGRFVIAWLSTGMCAMGAKWTHVAQRFPGLDHRLHETDVLFVEPA